MNPEKAWRAVRIVALIITFYLLAILSSRTFAKLSVPGPHPVFGPGTSLNIAHQGGNLERPDETAEAFRHGLEAGADVLEMDVHLSADGRLVVIHDSRVDRTTDGSGAVAEMTLPELKSLDAGYWWPYHSNNDVEKKNVPAGQEFPWRGRGLEILTLDEMLTAYPTTPMVVEVKAGGSAAAMAAVTLLDDFDRLDDVLIVSSKSEILSAFRDLAPEAATGADRSEVLRFWLMGRLGLAGFSGVKATALQVPVKQGSLRIITRGFIRRAHRQGLAVHAWTIDDEEEMTRLLKMGVDGIITNRPTLLSGLQD